MPQPFWDYDPTLDPLSAAMMRTRKTGELGLLSPQLPGQLPEEVNRGIRNVFGGILGPASAIPKKAAGAAQEYTETGQYNPEPVMDAATVAMTGGIPFKVPGTSLTSGLRRPPPAIGTYHGTGARGEFKEFKTPNPEVDLGIHSSIDPYVAANYAVPMPSTDPSGYVSQLAHERIKPLVLDVKNALKYPEDAIKWNQPSNVIDPLVHGMRSGFVAPRGLLSDMRNISATDKMWQSQFIPMLKDRGYDAIYYPHADPVPNWQKKYNTFMTFDPGQNLHRYTPEGQALIAERGIKEPMKMEGERWRLPGGVLKKPEEIESLVKLPGKNTARWWEDPKSDLYAMDYVHQQEVREANKIHRESMEAYKKEMEPSKKVLMQYINDTPGLEIPKGYKIDKYHPETSLEFLKAYNQPSSDNYTWKELWKYMNDYNKTLDKPVSQGLLTSYIKFGNSPLSAKSFFDKYIKADPNIKWMEYSP